MNNLGTTHWPGCGDTGEAKHWGCPKREVKMTDDSDKTDPAGSWMGRRNRIQCLSCLDIIEAFHEHDFKNCKCGKVGIDGGFQGHWRRLGGADNYKEMP